MSATFADFCRVWPMRSDAERVEAFRAFAELPQERRAETIFGCDALHAVMQDAGYPVPPAAEVLRRWLPAAFAYIGRTTPRIRKLMRSPA